MSDLITRASVLLHRHTDTPEGLDINVSIAGRVVRDERGPEFDGWILGAAVDDGSSQGGASVELTSEEEVEVLESALEAMARADEDAEAAREP